MTTVDRPAPPQNAPSLAFVASDGPSRRYDRL